MEFRIKSMSSSILTLFTSCCAVVDKPAVLLYSLRRYINRAWQITILACHSVIGKDLFADLQQELFMDS